MSGLLLLLLLHHFFVRGATPPVGPLLYQGCVVTLRHTTFGGTPLDE